MTRRKAAQEPLALEQPVGGTCECCGDETDAPLIARHGGFGLKCCFKCLNMSAAELAVAYGRRLRRISER